MAFNVDVTDLQGGVDLSDDAKLAAPTLTPITGRNEMRVEWSGASGQNPSAFLELRVRQDDAAQGVMNLLTIQWGDGESDIIYLGARTIDRRFTHVYFVPSSSIDVEISFKPPQDITFNTTINPGVQPSGDFHIEQLQFEKYEDDVKGVRPDWMDIAKVPTSFIDANVRRGFNYKFRVRARARIRGKSQIVTSAFSEVAQAGPWS